LTFTGVPHGCFLRDLPRRQGLGRVGFDERRSSDTSRYLGSGGAANRIMYDMLEQYMWPGISANRQGRRTGVEARH